MSAKNTFDSSDLLATAESIAIFLIPMILSNQAQIAEFLSIHGMNGTVIATIFSLLTYFARRFISGNTPTNTESVTVESTNISNPV